VLGYWGCDLGYIFEIERFADDEGKDLPKDFRGNVSDGGEDGFMGFYGLHEICAPKLKGRQGFVK
jgi:hypothetical protein